MLILQVFIFGGISLMGSVDTDVQGQLDTIEIFDPQTLTLSLLQGHKLPHPSHQIIPVQIQYRLMLLTGSPVGVDEAGDSVWEMNPKTGEVTDLKIKTNCALGNSALFVWNLWTFWRICFFRNLMKVQFEYTFHRCFQFDLTLTSFDNCKSCYCKFFIVISFQSL